MKIRNGFVSNSSSSSFCIYGVCVERGDEKHVFSDEIIKSIVAEQLDMVPREVSDETIRNFDLTEVDDLEYILAKSIGTDCWRGEEAFYFGRKWCRIKDDETGAQFKQSIEEKLRGAFKKEPKFETHDEVVYS